MYKYLKKIVSTDISEWKSKRLSNEIIKPDNTPAPTLAPTI